MGKMTINGKEFSGNSVSIVNGNVIIDGDNVTIGNKDRILKIEGNINGDIDCANLSVVGDIKGNIDCANATIEGNVVGDIDGANITINK